MEGGSYKPFSGSRIKARGKLPIWQNTKTQTSVILDSSLVDKLNKVTHFILLKCHHCSEV